MIQHHLISFAISFCVGLFLNAMNLLAYQIDHLYLSMTLIYGGLLMASHMIWSHQIVNYLAIGHFNIYQFSIGIGLSILITILMREQLGVDDAQYLRRMISHHSTALTTSHKIIQRTNNPELHKLAKDIIQTQEKEITQMKKMLNS